MQHFQGSCKQHEHAPRDDRQQRTVTPGSHVEHVLLGHLASPGHCSGAHQLSGAAYTTQPHLHVHPTPGGGRPSVCKSYLCSVPSHQLLSSNCPVSRPLLSEGARVKSPGDSAAALVALMPPQTAIYCDQSLPPQQHLPSISIPKQTLPSHPSLTPPAPAQSPPALP